MNLCRSLAACVAIPCVAGAASGAVVAYSWDRDLGTLARWDNPATNGVTTIGAGGYVEAADLCFSPAGVLYGLIGSDVVTVNLATGIPTAVAPITSTVFGLNETVEAMSFSPGGTLYSLTVSGTQSSIYVFDPVAGTATPVARGLNDAYFGMTFSPDGRLFATDGYDLFLLNPTTGAVTQTVGSLSEPVESLAWSPDGRLLGQTLFLENNGTFFAELFSVDPSSAKVTIIGGSGAFLEGLAVIPAPRATPVVCGLVLFAVGRRRSRGWGDEGARGVSSECRLL